MLHRVLYTVELCAIFPSVPRWMLTGLYEIVVGDIELLRVPGRFLRKLERTLLRGLKPGPSKEANYAVEIVKALSMIMFGIKI